MITQQSNEFMYSKNPDKKNGRGLQVYSTSQLQTVTGRDKDGRLLSWGLEQPYFYLTIQQRIEILRLSSPVFGVVTSRMNKLAGMKFNIVSEKKEEDRIAMDMKNVKSIYDEYSDSGDLTHLSLRAITYKKLLNQLPELKPDLSNFDSCLLRWKRRIKSVNIETCDNAKNWLLEPNQGVHWEDFVKKWVQDFHIHGSASIYKQEQGGVVQNFDVLPGGTIYRITSDFFSNVAGYVQIVPGFPGYTSYMEPQMYFSDEIVYSEYVPTSTRNYGFVPLEALIHKIAESLLFDQLMADQADGTKPPEKIIIVTDSNSWGSMDDSEKMDLPLDIDEQKKLEEKVNTPTKDGVMTFSGNSATILDLTRADTMGNQMQRQKDIREEVAMVFNMSNIEVNLTGSESTSGRSTSEAQIEIEQGKGIAPIAQSFTSAIQRGLLPFKFGSGLVFEFENAKNERDEKELDIISLQTGENTKNEIREKYGKEGFGSEYDKPEGALSGEVGESEFNPMYTQSIERNK